MTRVMQPTARSSTWGVGACLLPGSLVVMLTATLLFCGACSGHRALVFTTGTTIGVEATAEEGTEQHVVVGVKRFEGALVPTVYTVDGNDKVRAQAYSVFAALGFQTGLLQPTRIVQVFGTGEAAKTLASSPEAAANITKAAKGLAVTYNVRTIPLQDRIADWLDGPDSDERELLKAWLTDELGFEGSEALWLVGAPEKELQAAIIALDIP